MADPLARRTFLQTRGQPHRPVASLRSSARRWASRLTVLSLGTSLLSGCVSPSFRGSIARLSDSQIAVITTSVRVREHGLVIKGDVGRKDGYVRPLPGYLHIEGLDRGGRIVAAADTCWGEFIVRRFHLAYYRAFLSVSNPGSVAAITVAARADLSQPQK